MSRCRRRLGGRVGDGNSIQVLARNEYKHTCSTVAVESE